MRFLSSKSLLALAAALVPSLVHAQGFGGPIGSYAPPQVNPYPVYSPYLNLNRPGSSVAQNYFGLVQPQMQAQRNFQQLQNQMNNQGMGTGDVGYVDPSGQFINYFAPSAAGLQTGHNVTYFNYSHYYNFQGLRAFPGGPSRAGFPYGGIGGLGGYGLGGLGGIGGIGGIGAFGGRGFVGGTPFFSGGLNPLGGGFSTGTAMPFVFSPSGGGSTTTTTTGP
jgi:hypothetical protein